MTINPVRRLVLRSIGGLVLAPAIACLPGDGHGTHSYPVQLDLLAALVEGALLQIDWNDMRDVLTAMGNAPPVCAVIHDHDVGAVVKQCAEVLTQHPDPFNAVLVVASGNQSLRLNHCRAVFAAVTNATSTLESGLTTPPKVLLGAVVDAAISDGLRVTVLGS